LTITNPRRLAGASKTASPTVAGVVRCTTRRWLAGAPDAPHPNTPTSYRGARDQNSGKPARLPTGR
jgi:hypothetical protein